MGIFGSIPPGASHVRIQSDQPVVGLDVVNHYPVPAAEQAFLSARSVGAPSGSMRVFGLPQFRSGGDWQASVHLVNPSGSSLDVTLTAYQDDGTLWAGDNPKTVTLAANGALHGTVENLFGFTGTGERTGWIEASVSAVSLISALHLSNTANGSAALVSGIEILPACSLEVFDWAQEASDFSTSFSFANPGTAVATVAVWLIEADGSVRASGSVSVAPHRRSALTIRDLLPTGDFTGFVSVAAPGSILKAALLATAAGTGLAGIPPQNAGPLAHHLAFGVQPSTTPSRATISPVVTVRVENLYNDLVTCSNGPVTVAIGTNPGGGTLSGMTTVSVSGGIATFSDLSIEHPGVGYTLTANSPGLGGATSAPFDITSVPSRLSFGQQPTTTQAGSFITPAVTLRVEDEFGNLVTSSTATITVAIGTNPGGGILSGMLTMDAAGGIATFGDLSINKTGVGYTLTATSVPLAGATSIPFNITPGPATHLAFGQQPSGTGVGAIITPAVTVRVLDAFDNLVTGSAATITVAIGLNPGGGTLSGMTIVDATGGVATFANLSINRTGVGYTLTEAAAGLTGATSIPFNVAPVITSIDPNHAARGTQVNVYIYGLPNMTGINQVEVQPADGIVVDQITPTPGYVFTRFTIAVGAPATTRMVRVRANDGDWSNTLAFTVDP